jgi:hypothetical protein
MITTALQCLIKHGNCILNVAIECLELWLHIYGFFIGFVA